MAGVRCALMRGGTSKGALFLAADLPADPRARDILLLRIMGSPDPRQIDGLGGAHPLTSKVALVSPSADAAADVDYLFLQVGVDRPVVSASQTCGNILAAVAPFAVERGLVAAGRECTTVRVRMVNTGAVAAVRVCTPGGEVSYDGDTEITGVPGTAAPVLVEVQPPTRPLLPTGRSRDRMAGVDVTCIDNGMPCVLVAAEALGLVGTEEPSALEANAAVVERVARIRAAAAAAMGIGPDLSALTTPKIVIVSPPTAGGALTTRSFIPLRVHQALGVLAAAGVAAAVRLPDSVAGPLAQAPVTGPLRIEHPTGFVDVDVRHDERGRLVGTSLVSTARMIMDGVVRPGPARPGQAQPGERSGSTHPLAAAAAG